jgi:hypothetical protein
MNKNPTVKKTKMEEKKKMEPERICKNYGKTTKGEPYT